jgi:hypothetical protein
LAACAWTTFFPPWPPASSTTPPASTSSAASTPRPQRCRPPPRTRPCRQRWGRGAQGACGGSSSSRLWLRLAVCKAQPATDRAAGCMPPGCSAD